MTHAGAAGAGMEAEPTPTGSSGGTASGGTVEGGTVSGMTAEFGAAVEPGASSERAHGEASPSRSPSGRGSSGRDADGADASGHEAMQARRPDMSAVFERAIEGSPLMLFGMDRELRYRWLVNTLSPWSEEMLLGRTDEEIIGVEDASEITAAKRRVLETGSTERIELSLQLQRQRYWYEITLKRQDGEVLGTALDISEKKRREVMLQALLREVSHRSKNLLSVVLSIASQTSRKSFDKHTFLTRFTGRIQSISRSQDTITGSDWRGAALSELVDSQIRGNLTGRDARVVLEGRDVQLTPNAALHVGLALHELTTNALAHGAFLGDRGEVSIRVETPEPPEEGPAVIEWTETGARDADEPREDSFGMMTLKRIVPAAVAGKGTLTFRPDGMIYRLQISPSEYEVLRREL